MLRSPAWLLAAMFVVAMSLPTDSTVRGEELTLTLEGPVARIAPAGALVDQINAQRAALLASLQQLQDAYCRAALLDEALAVREQIRRLQQDAAVMLPSLNTINPRQAEMDNVFKRPIEVRNAVGESFYCQVTGATTGSVWGSGIYTSDSDLATAAVHAGFVNPGETKIVRFTILAGRLEYAGTEMNGVATSEWEHYPSSYRIDGAAVQAEDFDLMKLRGSDSGPLTVFVVGASSDDQRERMAEGNRPAPLIEFEDERDATPRAFVNAYPTTALLRERAFIGMRTIWGGEEGIYTDDSALAVAAVHAGLVGPGQPDFVTVELLPGREQYQGSTQHGVTSQAYGQWEGSYRIKAFEPAARE